MRLIKIYCLADPITLIPFYVGVTKGRLDYRLDGHIAEALSNKKKRVNGSDSYFKKCCAINNILDNKLQPLITILDIVSDFQVNDSERFYYNYLINLGFTLYQDAKRFNSESLYKPKQFVNQSVNNNLQILRIF